MFLITKDEKIADVIWKDPEIAKVFQKYNIKAFGWGSMGNYRIGDAARKKGIKLDNLLDDLNQYENTQ